MLKTKKNIIIIFSERVSGKWYLIMSITNEEYITKI